MAVLTWARLLGHAGGPATYFPTNFAIYDNLVVETLLTPIGTNFCTAATNSTGISGEISALGSDVAADNNVVLSTSSLPQNSFGFFLTSQDQGFTANPGGTLGNLCLGGAIGRYVGTGQILNSGTTGAFTMPLDLAATPTPTGLVSISAGEAWNFQAWYRDSLLGIPLSNLTDALTLTLL